jgi:PleD family two-component response regulator
MSEKARAGPNIAVVDDDASLREMLGEYLAAEGFRVFPFADGEAAAARLAAASPDLVVLDVMLPGIDGFEVLRCSGDHAHRSRRRRGPDRRPGDWRGRLPAEAVQPA